MKACVLESVGSLIYKEAPKPQPKENEALLKIRACGICSSDIDRVFKTGTYHFPTIPGHEFSGEIVELGKGADKRLLGKRAVAFPLLPCRECKSCQEKQYARCDNYNYFGSRCDGAFAEYLAVPTWNLLTFSDALEYRVAALCEPASVARHSVQAAGSLQGKAAVIVGSGTIAFLTALWAKKEGAGKIIMIGRSKAKQSFVKRLGIDNLYYVYDNINEQVQGITDGLGAEAAFECVGSEGAIAQAISLTDKGGTLVLTGNPQSDIHLERSIYWKILRNELTVRGTWNSSYNDTCNDWKETLTMMEEDSSRFGQLITHTFRLEQHKEAFKTLMDAGDLSLKVMFEM